jgi:hypothetical protein
LLEKTAGRPSADAPKGYQKDGQKFFRMTNKIAVDGDDREHSSDADPHERE